MTVAAFVRLAMIRVMLSRQSTFWAGPRSYRIPCRFGTFAFLVTWLVTAFRARIRPSNLPF